MQASPGCVREAPRSAAPFRRSRFTPADAAELADFLNDLRAHHWTLTSLAHQREPEVKPLVTARALVEAERSPERIGTFLLRRAGAIIACVVVDEKAEAGHRVAVFSGAETHPEYQRRGTFWRWLGLPLIRAFCRSSFDRLEAVTWALNRKGIPVYERFGFRRVPGTSLRLVNYLPAVLRHPEVRRLLGEGDFLRQLERPPARESAPRGQTVYNFAVSAGRVSVAVDEAACRVQSVAFVPSR